MAVRQSVMLDMDQKSDLEEAFKNIDSDNSGWIEVDELHAALQVVGCKIPMYKVRLLIKEFDIDEDKKVSLEEFEKMYAKVKSTEDYGRYFKKAITTRKDIQMTSGSTEGTTHTIKDSERFAFADWINKNLGEDEECAHMLPIDPESNDLFEKVKDGVLLCKLINHSVPGTIDERTINKTKLNVYLSTENQNLAINSAQAIGCFVVNIGHSDIQQGKPHLILGLLWQIIRIGLLSDINLADHPNLASLLEEGESIEDLVKLSPEEILIRWVNYQLAKAGDPRRISNFSSDIKDSEVYFTVLDQISPQRNFIDRSGVHISDMNDRAEAMLCEADRIDCRAFITPSDVVKGNPKLNLAFVANLFNTYPSLDPVEDPELQIDEESREERTYRNWMNSMGVSPHVNRMSVDLADGLILFQLYEIIKANSVNWSKVIKKFSKLKANFEKLENCNYAIDLGKEMQFSLVGICGNDIKSCNSTLTLALVWQLMRAYTVAMLKKVSEDGNPIEDKMIVQWANETLQEGGKTSRVSSFNDSSLADSKTILDLIDCIAPGKVNYDNLKEPIPAGSSDENRDAENHDRMLMNAKFAISMGRKIGARIYALPEDIVEVKSKMVMTIFACLMTIGLEKMNREKSS